MVDNLEQLFKVRTIKGYYCHLKHIDIKDTNLIHDLRLKRPDFIERTSPNLEVQKLYLEQYLNSFQKHMQIYYKVYDLKENKIIDFIKFDIGSLCIITGGSNIGKIGLVINREKHYGRDETVKIRDGSHNEFSTKLDNVFVIGKGKKAFISLPKIKIL